MIFARNNRFFYTIIGLALLVIGVLFLFFTTKSRTAPGFVQHDTPEATLISEATAILVSIADTPLERERGLSGTAPLAEGVGKLFVFEDEGFHGFWMKDMKYAIDIIWLNEKMEIVDITVAATPETYPEIFTPGMPARYVLEVSAGFSTAKKLAVGQTFTLSK